MFPPLSNITNLGSRSGSVSNSINIDPSLFYRKDQDVIIN